jgi:hypothetical protein
MYSIMSVRASYVQEFVNKYGTVPKLETAGPHRKIFHNPNETRAGIVTAGGLCPGLNNVIKGLVEVLAFDGCNEDELAFVTKAMAEGELTEKLNSISSISVESFIRVTDY